MKSAKPLPTILQNRRWLRRLDPFPHYMVRDVFIPEVATELSEAVTKVVGSEDRMAHFGWYDAYGTNFEPEEEWPLRVFISRAWHDMLAGLTGIQATGRVNGGIHHHTVGSKSGFVHHDLNPVYFNEDPTWDRQGDLAFMARHDLVGYTTGEALVPDVTVVKEVRAVAVLYYTANEDWSPGAGGETGLFHEQTDSVDEAAVKAPPLNNSMLIFPCTPHSYHSFLSNPKLERNSIVMWLHRSVDDTAAIWGPDAPMGWKRNRNRKAPK